MIRLLSTGPSTISTLLARENTERRSSIPSVIDLLTQSGMPAHPPGGPKRRSVPRAAMVNRSLRQSGR